MSEAEASKTGFFLRLVATARGEVAADALEAYRRAGATVWRSLEDLNERHHALDATDRSPWTQDGGTRAERLCVWNAFCLQSAGDELLDADYALDPGTVGHVPPAIAEHTLAFYSQVEGWISRAYQARCNPHYALDVTVPAGSVPWPSRGFDTPTHMEALLSVGTAFQRRILVETFAPTKKLQYSPAAPAT